MLCAVRLQVTIKNMNKKNIRLIQDSVCLISAFPQLKGVRVPCCLVLPSHNAC
jgi:hypothetical protein